MKTSTAGRQFIERFEGLILQSYDDAGDKIIHAGDPVRGTLTIGYGHTSAAGAPKVTPGMVITKEQADSILASDLAKVEAAVTRLVTVPLTQNQFDALVSFHFNTGSLGKSTLLKVLNTKDYAGAADHFMDYTKGRINGQLVQMNGLVRRRTDEKTMFLKKDTTTGPIVATATVAAGAGIGQYFDVHHAVIIIGSLLVALVAGYLVHLYINKGN